VKLLRVHSILGATALLLRLLAQRTRAQLLGMSHPAGSFAAADGGRIDIGSDRSTDASRLLDASWVDEHSIAAGRSVAGDGDAAPTRSAADS
jgi:hypothetical protein